MSLQTRRPPGHGKRKALAFAADIASLRAAGHSLEAIREALEDAGVIVSISTVRRELLSRPPVRAAAAGCSPGDATASRSNHIEQRRAITGPEAVPSPSLTALPLPGKAIAEEFMRGRPTNTLLFEESSK